MSYSSSTLNSRFQRNSNSLILTIIISLKFLVYFQAPNHQLVHVLLNQKLLFSVIHGTGSSLWMNQDQLALQTGLKFSGFYGTSDGGLTSGIHIVSNVSLLTLLIPELLFHLHNIMSMLLQILSTHPQLLEMVEEQILDSL